MVLKRIFGGRVPHKHVQQYQGVSEAWMQREQERLSDISIDLGIDTKITRAGGQIELESSNIKDAAMLRLRAFGNDFNPGLHVHEENFTSGDEVYRDAYLTHARNAIKDMGLTCQVEQDGNQVYLRFDTTGEHALFTEMRDRGVFHRLALTDIGGPAIQP